jgi:hypothetical protein
VDFFELMANVMANPLDAWAVNLVLNSSLMIKNDIHSCSYHEGLSVSKLMILICTCLLDQVLHT